MLSISWLVVQRITSLLCKESSYLCGILPLLVRGSAPSLKYSIVKSAFLISLPTSRPLVSSSSVNQVAIHLWLNPEASISWWWPQPPRTEVTETLSSNQSQHTPLSVALPHFTSLHTSSPGLSRAPHYPHHNRESHASRPRIPCFPHCSPGSSFLQHPVLNTVLSKFGHPSATWPGHAHWLTLLHLSTNSPGLFLPDCLCTLLPSPRTLGRIRVPQKPGHPIPLHPCPADVTRFRCVHPTDCWCLLWVSIISGQFTSTWPLCWLYFLQHQK